MTGNPIKRPTDDCYPTPPEATRALLSVEAFPCGVWEPCAGPGDLAAVLREAGYTVRATTVYDGRHERDMPKHRVIGNLDFLNTSETNHPNIVTNPPYGMLHGKKNRKAAEIIVRHALSLRPSKVAMLLPMQFLGGEGRKNGLFAEHPPTRFYQFSDRLKFYPAGIDTDGLSGPKHYFAWFIWEYPFAVRLPQFGGWLNSKEFLNGGTGHA